MVGAESYGNYFALFNFAYIFSILLDFGINQWHNRETSREPALLKEQILPRYFLKLSLGFLYVFVVFVFAILLGFTSDQRSLLLILLLNQFLLSSILFCRASLGGLQAFKKDSVISVLDKSLMIIFCALLIWGNSSNLEMNIWNFALAQCLAYAFTFLISAFFLLSTSGTWIWPKERFDWWAVLKKSLPYALLIILMSLYNRVDAVMLERMLPDGKSEAGIYAAAYRLLDGANQFGLLTATILFPLFSRMIKESESVQRLVKFSASIVLSVSMAIALFSWFYSQEIMDLLYVESTPYYAQILAYLLPAFVPIASVYVFGSLLTANGSLRELNYLALSGLFLNVLLNLLLIPIYKAWGASLATLGTQMLVGALHIWLAHRVFKLGINWSLIGRYVALMVIGYLIYHFSTTMPWNWIFSAGIATLAFFFTSIILGVLQPAELKSYSRA